MPSGINVPGTTAYYRNQKKPPIGSSPTVPVAGGTLMQNYVQTRAQQNVHAPVQATPVTPTVTPTPAAPVTPVPAPAATPVPPPAAVPPPVATPVRAATPVPVQAPVAPPPAATYNPAAKAGATGSSLQDPGQITGAGQAYAQRVMQNVQGDNPLITQARQSEDTAAARRAYLARKGTTEALAQTPFTPGSAQYQRALDESRAGVNAANQEGQNQVNAVTRQATRDAFTDANALEDQQYGRAVGERTYQTQQNQDLSASIQDPKAKYAYQRMIASGVSPQDAYAAVVGESGTVNEQYRGQSPVQQVQQDATDWVKATTDLAPGTPEFQAAVRARMTALDKTQNQPVTQATKEADKQTLDEAIKRGDKLSADQLELAKTSGLAVQQSLQGMPKGLAVDGWLRDNPSGLVNVDGKVYKVVKGDRAGTGSGDYNNQVRHTDWVEVVDLQTGQTKYIVGPYNNPGGSRDEGFDKNKAGIYDKPPTMSDSSGDWTPFGI